MSTKNYTILSIYSHKGGGGKTTTVDIIRGAVMNSDRSAPRFKFKKVLMIDVDTQMNLTCKLLETEERFQEYFESLSEINDFQHNVHNMDIKTKLARLMNYNTRNAVNPNPMVIDLIPGYPEVQQFPSRWRWNSTSPGRLSMHAERFKI